MMAHVFVTEDLETVIRKRAAFIVKRQQHRDPSKWYDGLYSVYDREKGMLCSPDRLGAFARHPFVVGGSDDPSNGKPLYVSEKNVAYPDADEIASLEYYERNFVWGKLQRMDGESPFPYGIYGSDNWHENRSGRRGGYNSGGSGRERMWRTFDYVVTCDGRQAAAFQAKGRRTEVVLPLKGRNGSANRIEIRPALKSR